MLDSYLEEERVKEEVVRRIQQQHLSHQQRASEFVRSTFLKEFGFIWMAKRHIIPEIFSVAEDEPSVENQLGHNSFGWEHLNIPDSNTAGCSSVQVAENMELWRNTVSKYADHFTLYVSHKVRIRNESSTIANNNHRVIFQTYQVRFTLAQFPDELFTYHKGSMKCVFLIALCLRDIFLHETDGTISDREDTSPEKAEMLAICKALVPQSPQSIKNHLIDAFVISAKEYDAKHCENHSRKANPTEGFSHTQSEEHIESDEDSDEEIRNVMNSSNMSFD